ncbi:MAG: DUF202 domain-containing protein [Candidatus Diapherotrites archaeon]|nr:DUF202 domain-containing protein [Candidatus Diapherotrites archaeon]MDZ4256605.1 DUF202 domain-containing protein [archaeon]
MPKVIPEDFSVDMRTILAKERTILSHQRLQINLIGIGLGLFATGFTLLRLVPTETFSFRIIEAVFIFGGGILCTLSVMQYYHLNKQLKESEAIEEYLAREFRVEHMEMPAYIHKHPARTKSIGKTFWDAFMR